MVKTVPLTKCNTVTNYKGGGKNDPPNVFNCIQGGQLLRAGGCVQAPLTPPPDKYSPVIQQKVEMGT